MYIHSTSRAFRIYSSTAISTSRRTTPRFSLLPSSSRFKCSYSCSRLSHPHKPLRSSAPTTVLVAIALTTCFITATSVYLIPTAQHFGDSTLLEADGAQTIFTKDRRMTGPNPPGRPGNLTPDQETKLRELWSATMKVFGVSPPDGHDGADDQDAQSHLGVPDKKKKKRHSMFRRHKDDYDDDGASTDQEDKYGQSKEFQQVIATQNPEDLRKAFWSMVKHDHPDGLLLRFLRARKWDVHNALVMLVATMHWRLKDMHVDDDIIKKGEGAALADSTSSNPAAKKEGEDFLAQMRLGKSFLHGTDREGRPMCFVRVRLHRQGEQTESSLERYTVYTIETARLLLAPPVDTAVSVHSISPETSLIIAGNRLRYDGLLNGEYGMSHEDRITKAPLTVSRTTLPLNS